MEEVLTKVKTNVIICLLKYNNKKNVYFQNNFQNMLDLLLSRIVMIKKIKYRIGMNIYKLSVLLIKCNYF